MRMIKVLNKRMHILHMPTGEELRPGVNEVSARSLERCEDNATFRSWVKLGWIAEADEPPPEDHEEPSESEDNEKKGA